MTVSHDLSYLVATWDPSRFSGDRSVAAVAERDGIATVAVTRGRTGRLGVGRMTENQLQRAAANEFLRMAGEQLAAAGLQSNVSPDHFSAHTSRNLRTGEVALTWSGSGGDVHYIGEYGSLPEPVRDVLAGAKELHRILR